MYPGLLQVIRVGHCVGSKTQDWSSHFQGWVNGQLYELSVKFEQFLEQVWSAQREYSGGHPGCEGQYWASRRHVPDWAQ